MADLSTLFDLARDLHKHHKEHRTSEVELEQEHDALGTSIAVHFQVPMPPRATAVANLKTAWGFTIGSHDDHIFRDESGDFFTLAPVVNQVAALYIPYGVLRHRKAGVYTMSLTVVLQPSPGSSGARIAEAEAKIALPPPQPWRKVDYLWPFIALCMTVVRADDEITAAEIRPLKALLIEEFCLGPADLDGLRLAMKSPPPADLGALVAAVRLRMPFLPPQDLLATLLRIARADGPVNPREHSALRTIAAHAGLDEHNWSRLVDRHAL